MVINFVSIVVIIGKEIMHFLDHFKPITSLTLLLISAFFANLSVLIIGWFNITTTTSVRPHETDKQSQILGLTVDEISMVIRRLGMCSDFDLDNEETYIDQGVFEGMFVKEEPSLEEIWQVFKVFDCNKDGFIDAGDLGRVLCDLGLIKEGSNVERCKLMIMGFDSNRDGLLDFNDFLKLMETCLCS